MRKERVMVQCEAHFYFIYVTSSFEPKVWSQNLSMCFHVIENDGGSPKCVGSLINKCILIVFFFGVASNVILLYVVTICSQIINSEFA
jgi:hypothetical protein